MSADESARAVFDPAAFALQTGGDADLRAEIIQMFLEDCPMRVEDIRAAISSGDTAELVSSAHALKGSAAYLAASIVRECAGELERLGREGDLAAAPAALEQLDAAVAVLLVELHKITS